jgi:phosphoglycolate phosphatase
MLLVFDLDGTLVDSSRDLADSANALLVSYAAAPLDEPSVIRMVGEGAAVLVARLMAARRIDADPAEALARFLAFYDERLLAHTHPYAGIPAALDELRGWARLAVLTNKPGAATARILHGLGLRPAFDWVIGGDAAIGRKPDPAGLRWLVREAGADAEPAVMIGDSLIDLRTARNAGTHVCLARYGFGFASFPPDVFRGDELFVDAAPELPAVLRTLHTRAALAGQRPKGSSQEA